MHSDQILHFLSMTKAPLTTFSDDDRTILSKIPGLLLNFNPNNPQNFASKIFEILTCSESYSSLHRVCIAKRLGMSNTLMVISSEHKLQAPNRMGLGYSCFVRPDSTLLELKSTDIRIFSNAAEVVQSFHERNEPAQRSIQRIAEAGFKAGICLPLFSGGRNLGFLFLNSLDFGFSDIRPIDYCIFSYLQTIAATALGLNEKPSEYYFSLAEKNARDYIGDFFDLSRLQLSLRRHLDALAVEATVQVTAREGSDFLLSHGLLAHIVSRFTEACQAPRVDVRFLETSEQKLHVEITAESGITKPILMQQLLQDCRILEVDAYLGQGNLDIRLPCDQIGVQKPFRYSIDPIVHKAS